MNIVDVIALAKAGYKKKDIEELMAIEVPDTQEKQEPMAEEPQKEEPEPIQEEKVEEVDYKKLYEESQEQLKAVQLSNVQKDIEADTRQSDEDILTDIIKNSR